MIDVQIPTMRKFWGQSQVPESADIFCRSFLTGLEQIAVSTIAVAGEHGMYAQAQLDRTGDTSFRIGQCAVQIKENRFRHLEHPLADKEVAVLPGYEPGIFCQPQDI